MLADQLSKSWDERRRSAPIEAAMRFSDKGLVLGAGTVLAPAAASGRDLAIGPLAPRLTALLAAAHLRKPTPLALAHLRKAADCRRGGQDALAAMHLVLSQVDRLRQPEADAHRLFLADGLLENGAEPDVIIDALESGEVAFDRLKKKYNPEEPRVPAGNGITSGRWTTSDGLSQQPSAEVNPETVTPVGNTKGSYQGPEACFKARTDCQVNFLHAKWNGKISDSTYRENFQECIKWGRICDQIEDVTWDSDRFTFGSTIFPDGGVVILKDGVEPYPREIARIKFPRLHMPDL